MKKKGQALQALPGMAILLVVCAIVLTIGASIVTSVQTGFTANGFAYNASQYGLQGINSLAGYQPTIGIVVAAAVVIGLILTAFRFGGGM